MIYIIYEKKWVCDKIINIWKKYNDGKYTNDINKATKIWLFNHYMYKKVPKIGLEVIVTIHHLEESKLDVEEFREMDEVVSYYHSISPKTTEILRKYTSKKIVELVMPLDVGDNFFMVGKNELRKKWGFKENDFLIGNFQRDTEKNGEPKLEKGPDILVKLLENYGDNLVVVLSGYRRGYLVKELERRGIRYFYGENVGEREMNELYNILDLYVISSRVEGGPRVVFECALSRCPVVGTDVGVVGVILGKESIYDWRDLGSYGVVRPNVEEAYKNVVKYLAPVYMIEFNMRLFG